MVEEGVAEVHVVEALGWGLVRGGVIEVCGRLDVVEGSEGGGGVRVDLHQL